MQQNIQQYNSGASYRSPSFFDVEATRERLETQLRAESFPVTMAEMARRAEAMHTVFQRDNPEQLEPWEKEPLHLELFMRTPKEHEVILAKFGSTKGTEFNASNYMDAFYADPNSWRYLTDAPETTLVAHTYEMSWCWW
jgi:hypothetical protein